MKSSSLKLSYIDRVIGFYFDGGFHQMIIDAELDEEEINEWANVAVLFEACINEIKEPSQQDRKALLSLIEDLYALAEVDLSVGEKLNESLLNEIEVGLDYTKYKHIIKKAFDLICVHGKELYVE